jgi:hypothetical protein
MPLPPLPPDPTPTEQDLCRFDHLIDDENPSIYDKYFTEEQARWIKRAMLWRKYLQAANPNAFLLQIPRGNYTEYLRSPEWRELRARVLAQANYECSGCDKRAMEVHHRDYRPRVLSGEDLVPLVALCATCHHDTHFAGPGLKRERWIEQERALAAMVQAKEEKNSD